MTPPLSGTSTEYAKVATAPKAVARVSGSAITGNRITLDGSASSGDDLRFRWVQTRGKALRIEDHDRAIAHFVMPDAPDSLGFMLIVTAPHGSDTAEITTLAGNPRTPAVLASTPVADAGDDQIALIGHQVTLHGGRSEPQGQVGYRWIQTGGPPVRFKIEEKHIYSFVPAMPGVFRFALVVANGSEISAPDEVTVTVGAADQGPSSRRGPVTVSPEVPMPTQELARTSLASVKDGAEAAEPLAIIFGEAADRMDLYRTYSDAFSEMSRRMEDVLPQNPTTRNAWIERVFGPLSARTLEVMRSEGLNLDVAEGQSVPLTASQKAALADHFRLIAEGFRTKSVPR